MKNPGSINRWKSTALAAFVATSAGLWTLDAAAMALGKLSVLSALGEPLRAEIELPEITGSEFDTLKASPASAASFKAAGFEFSPTISGLNIEVLRRPDGRAYLRLKSDRVVNEPFLDLILEANWSSGRIVRDYTLLFDPPANRQAQAEPVNAPQMAATTPLNNVQRVTPETTPPVVRPAESAAPVRAPISARAPIVVKPAIVAAPPTPTGNTLTVKLGDTASKIASSIKPASISLDQMLVALMRANPDAFLRNNVNRIRAGAVLDLPDAASAAAIPSDEARQTIMAQSRDFNDFRRKLASNAPKVDMAPAERTASGKVQTQVDEKKPATVAPDKLTLSKSPVTQAKGALSGEEKIAQEKLAKSQADRAAELSKNISDLSKLSSADNAAAKPSDQPKVPAAPASTPPTPPAPTPGVELAAAPPPAQTPVAAPAEPEAKPVAAQAPEAPQKPKAPPAAPPPVEADDGLLSLLGDDPVIPAAGGGVLALLAGFGIYRYLRRRRAGHVDSSFLESRLQPDSFFGASGGQRVDTSDSSTGSSSMAYSPSQLDAGDVDPVAEADVYLAYGRDLQAEEILKEALKVNPNRVAIHAKLLEIHSKRRDIPAFNALAAEALRLTQGQGTEWARIKDLGRELDPANPMYGSGDVKPAAPVASKLDDSPGFSQPTQPSTDNVDLDLDLDLGLPDMQSTVTDFAPPPSPAPDPFADLNLELDPQQVEEVGNQATAYEEPVTSVEIEPMPALTEPASPGDLSIDLSEDLDFPTGNTTTPASLEQDSPLPSTPSDSGMIEFDLDSLAMDLEPTDSMAQSPAAETIHTPLESETPSDTEQELTPEDPLATKLALAEEFNAIGDADGARALIEEVIAEAQGSLKAKAQRLLGQLD
jgi:pilus assembly protein FimV